MSQTHYINGEWLKGQGSVFTSISPATSEVIWEGEMASSKEAEKAFEAAYDAQKTWESLSLDERITPLKRYKEVLEKETEGLALAISMEVGKPLWESKTEVAGMIGKLDVTIKAYHERTPYKHNQSNGLETRLTHRPHGVVAILGPYNFPGHLPNGQIIPALLAGNTVIFKPSELTPMVGEKLIDCFHQADFPKGVINLIQGARLTGKALLKQPVNGVFFTGSYQTGQLIHKQFGGRPEVILALEMGGNNPLIVDEVKDIDAALFNTLMSAFITSGQRCTCARRLLLPKNQFGDAFLKALIDKTKRLKLGAYTETPEPFMGPVISEGVSERLLKIQSDFIEQGAVAHLSMVSKGNALLTPGIIELHETAPTFDEEIFGPLLSIYRYSEMEEAIAKANDTAYGLSAGILTDNHAHADYFYQNIKAGIANINRQMTGASGSAPFGGIGRSGNHRPAAFYASDFCAYPMASMVSESPFMPESLPSGMA